MIWSNSRLDQTTHALLPWITQHAFYEQDRVTRICGPTRRFALASEVGVQLAAVGEPDPG
jgi:hypothetical protein